MKDFISISARFVSRGAVVAAVCLVAAIASGCSSGASLTIESSKDHQLYQPKFDAAYVSGGARGDLDVVATSQSKSRAQDGGGPVEEVLHVHVLWQPMRGTKADSMSAANAVLHWYILSNDRAQTRLMTYEGAAFAAVDDSGDRTQIILRNASLKPAARTGGMIDPIGPATIEGTISAEKDRKKVEALLSRVELSMTAAARQSPPQKQASSRAGE